jgi:hypothetical protein
MDGLTVNSDSAAADFIGKNAKNHLGATMVVYGDRRFIIIVLDCIDKSK